MSGKVRTIAVTGVNAKPENPGPGLAVARGLRQAYGSQVRIVGLGYDVLDAGLYLSEFCDAAHLLPYPSAGEQQLLARLAQIQEQESIDVLIPCLDAELMSFSRLAGELRRVGMRICLPSRDQLRARNKDCLDELAQKAEVGYPETMRISSPGFFYRCHEQGWNYPMVVKGIFYDAVVVHHAEEGVAAFRRIAAEWGLPVLVQRHVKGHEVNLVALGDGQGGMLGAVMMRKQAVTDKGKAWSGITIMDRRLEEIAGRLVAVLRWPGPLEVEVLKEERSGRYLLIEINPRFPAWVHLATAAGVNLPAAWVESILEESMPRLPAPAIGKMMIRYAMETVIDIQTFESMTIAGSIHDMGGEI